MTGRGHRSVEFDAPRKYLGKETILNYWRIAKQLDLEQKTNQHELYLVSLYVTGGRIQEVLKLRPEQIRWNEEAIFIDRMEVLKRRKRWTRDVLIKRDALDPLASIFIDLVNSCNTQYLLPARTKFTSKIIPEKHISTFTVYTKIKEIPDMTLRGKTLWPHLLRDQRAYFFKEIRGFDPYELQKWFSWARMDMPAHYVGNPETKKLAEKLGIKNIPS